MRIDIQIPAHLRHQVAADFFLPILEGGVFFAEVQMLPRLGARQHLAVVPHFARRLNPVEDALPSCAAAQIRGQRLPDLVAIRGAISLQQRRGTNENPRNAEPALDTAFMHERLTQDLLHILRQPLERNDICAFHLFRFAQARQRRMPIDEHQAAAARAFRRTPVFHRDDTAVLAQNLARQTPAFVKEKLKDDKAEVRLAAARVAVLRNLPVVNELIDQLADDNDGVRDFAHQTLVRVARGADYGPKKSADKEEDP